MGNRGLKVVDYNEYERYERMNIMRYPMMIMERGRVVYYVNIREIIRDEMIERIKEPFVIWVPK